MEINEERQSNIIELINSIRGSSFVDEVLDVRAMSDGFTVFVRGKDGNAYELEIRPASLAKGHEDLRKKDSYVERVKKRREEARRNFGL